MFQLTRNIIGATLLILSLLSLVTASCKSGEVNNDPLDPNSRRNRLFRYEPNTPQTPPNGLLTVSNYNIQSGFSLNCKNPSLNLPAQFKKLVNCHYFTAEEVDINTTHCDCNQPEKASIATGKTVLYLRTVYYQGGLYGHMAGAVYPILDAQYIIYKSYSSEVRGATAQRSRPPQLGGRDLWVISTHLQYDSVMIRTEQSQELVAFAKKIASMYPDAVIICPGDYYVQYGDPDYATLTAYFKDAYYEWSGVRTGGSTFPSNDPDLRFDYQFYRAPPGFNMKVQSYQVINTQASDHCPLRIRYTFPSVKVSNPRSAAAVAEAADPLDSEWDDSELAFFPPSTLNNVRDMSGCKARYLIVERPDSSWVSNGRTYRIFDITIINSGRCTITTANVFLPDPAMISDSWNYNVTTGAINIYGVMDNHKSSVAGFITYSNKTFMNSDTRFVYSCFTCDNHFARERTNNCGVSVELTPRNGTGSSWTSDGQYYQIYDISASNYGTKPVNKIVIAITADGTISQSWNLKPVNSERRTYQFSLFGNKLAAGQTYDNTSGFIVGSSEPGISPATAVWLIRSTC